MTFFSVSVPVKVVLRQHINDESSQTKKRFPTHDVAAAHTPPFSAHKIVLLFSVKCPDNP